jgi:hypothetical protein
MDLDGLVIAVGEAEDGGLKVGDTPIKKPCGGSSSLEALLQGPVLRCELTDAGAGRCCQR